MLPLNTRTCLFLTLGAVTLAGVGAPASAHAPAPASSQTTTAPAPTAPASTVQAPAVPGRSVSFALFGDTPYGDAQIAAFPSTIRQISTAPGIRYAVHVGDIKNGSTRCDTEYFRWVRTVFDTSRVPLVYTPGDNEWTDCHRANNGSYNPLERLSALRTVMYNRDGSPLGRGHLKVRTQARAGMPENAEWETNGVRFATVNVQGSHNGLDPWTGLGKTQVTPEQQAEFTARMAANTAQITRQFDRAKHEKNTAVAIVLQADMFDSYLASDPAAARAAFGPIIKAIADGARTSGKPVYILNGDSHSYKQLNPLAPGSAWLGVYDVAPVSTLTQVTVEGAATVHEFTKVTIQAPVAVRKGFAPLTFTRVPLS